jgi:hypothetical protein
MRLQQFNLLLLLSASQAWATASGRGLERPEAETKLPPSQLFSETATAKIWGTAVRSFDQVSGWE